MLQAFYNYNYLIRTKSWTKNFFVLAPVIFSFKFANYQACNSILLAFFAFCFASSFIYIINDIVDVNKDRLHPRKCKRPLPANVIKISSAIVIAIVLLISSIILSFNLSNSFKLILLIYLIINVLYTFVFKYISIIESISIAFGFVLRVLAGCYAINAKPSHWIIVITFFVALFLAFIKRKSELIMLQDEAAEHRKVLGNYTIPLLDKYILICAAITLSAYLLYTIDPIVIKNFNTDLITYSTLFVVIGLFRFIQLSDSNKYEGEADPTTLIFKDFFIQITLVLYILYIIYIIYISKW